MKINQIKTEEELNSYFLKEREKIIKKYKINSLELPTVESYSREIQSLINKCGNRLTSINKKEKNK